MTNLPAASHPPPTTIRGHAIAVCSWSLRPESPTALARSVRAAGFDAVQLAIGPIVRGLWREDETFRILHDHGVRVVSGMLAPVGEDYTTLESIRQTGGVRPGATWPANHRLAHQVADLCARHQIGLCTFHAGLVPAEPGSRAAMIDRLVAMIQAFNDPALGRSVAVAFETGQEPPHEQAAVLRDVRAALAHTPGAEARVGINFDPANVILYGVAEPMEALGVLAPHILQVHIKDATPSATPGVWGAEVPAGEGRVPWPQFLAAVHGAHPTVSLVVEREAGESRISDAAGARALVESLLGGTSVPRGTSDV